MVSKTLKKIERAAKNYRWSDRNKDLAVLEELLKENGGELKLLEKVDYPEPGKDDVQVLFGNVISKWLMYLDKKYGKWISQLIFRRFLADHVSRGGM